MPIAPFRDCHLYYEVHGKGPAIVFAHGLGGNSLSWWQQVPYFARSHTCVVYDQPGFARSGAPSGENWTFADALGALLDHLGMEQSVLVAQSMGGWTCLAYTLQHPERVRALVMGSTPGVARTPPGLAGWREKIRPERERLSAVGVQASYGERGAVDRPDLHYLYGAIRRLTQPPHPSSPPGVGRLGKASADELSRLRVPVLFLIGEKDAVIPPDVTAAAAGLIPGARVQRVADTGHSIYFERADTFNRLIERFLAEV